MSGNRRLENVALDHAERGYHVFPCRPRDKVPLLPKANGGEGFKNATRNERQILDWWDRQPKANVGIACGASGISVVDVDSKHGADPRVVIPQLGLEHHPATVLTGAAPEVSEKHPNSLPGVRGAQLYFAGELRNTKLTIPGVEIRGAGGYVMAPGSIHPSGLMYVGVSPEVSALSQIPQAILDLVPAKSPNGSAPPVGDTIPHGEQHDTLVSFAGTMRRRGADADTIAAALKVMNKRCEVPGTDEEMERIAGSMMRYPGSATAPGGIFFFPKETTEENFEKGSLFTVRQLREDRMTAPKWAYEGFFTIGSLTALIGVGGAGKGTLMSYLVAGWTKGSLPGQHHGRPVNVLVVGDEDSPDQVWTPRIVAAGGDVSRVFGLEYKAGVALDIVRHIGELDRFVEEHDIKVVYLDQILDQLHGDLNSHVAHDVRGGLAPLRALAGRRDICVAYTMHPNKGSARGVRDRAGASGQFTDVARSVLILGYHPERPGVRAMARGKGNMGAIPDTLTFSIEGQTVFNPQTGEAIGASVVKNVAVDLDLAAEEISNTPGGPPEESKPEVIERVMFELGGDGKPHLRSEAEAACLDAGVSRSTFAKNYPHLDYIERAGKEWRLAQ